MGRIGWIIAGVLGTGVLVTAGMFFRDMRAAYARLQGKSELVESPYGPIEVATGGQGIPVLVVHGSGGGFDQGELLVRAVLGDGFRWIAPSRFGYLRSACPEGATFDDQAHAYAHLLDQLGVKRVAVVALSHGGPSALLLAALHPERVSSLSLVSAGVASTAASQQAEASDRGAMLTTVFQHDLLYWSLSKLLKRQLMALMGASEEVIAGLSMQQRALVEEVIDSMNPVAPRSAGVRFDNRATLPNERIAAIGAPTLIFHARDDGLQIYANAEFAAAHIPGAELVAFDHGGHLLMAVEQGAIRERLHAHIRKHANEAGRD